MNEAIKRGLGATERRTEEIELPVHDMRVPMVNLDKALQLFGALEDEEIIDKMALGT